MKQIDQRDSRLRFPIGIVVSRFNEGVTRKLLDGALRRLKEKDFDESEITVAWVPGAIEIPVVAQRMAQLGRLEAIVALGAVIRGDTSHFDYVCKQVSDGCQAVSLQHDLPVIFGVLTTNTEDEALARAGGAMGNKGCEAIDACVETVSVLRQIDRND